MAQKVHIVLEDDIDGSEAEETIPFALDGKSYEIDLNSSNAAKLRDALAPYISAGRRSSGKSSGSRRSSGSGSASANGGSSDPKKIREWAESQGIDVPSRGRVPAAVRDAYDKAH